MARFASAREHSAMFLSRFRPIADEHRTGAPTTTIRPCRRATPCSPSVCGCVMSLGADAIVHMGAHGTLEWLPGKAVALTGSCFPESVVGALPVIYPFIVSNPGEAAQAKRRIAAVTIGHLPPPLVGRRAVRRRAGAGASGRRICPGRRARPPPPRTAGAADRRKCTAQRACARSRHRCAVPSADEACAASMPGCAT